MLKRVITITILALGPVAVFGQKAKPRPKPKPVKHIVIIGDRNFACVESPTPSRSRPSWMPISGGILNSRAISLPEPVLPEVPTEGVVNVQVVIDEEGNVSRASAASGTAILKAPAVAAARNAKFAQTLLGGRPVKVLGILIYDFTAHRREKKPVNRQSKAGQNKKASKIVSGGVMNGKAVSLPVPVYPPAARAVRFEGVVGVKVLIDEEGKVVSASSSGHPLLRAAAVKAAREAAFAPMSLGGEPIRVSGSIDYIFRLDMDWGQTGRFLSEAETGRGNGEMLQVIAAKLPDDFLEEKAEIGALVHLTRSTYTKPGELNERAAKVIGSIEEKLLNDPVNSWQFRFRVTLGRIKGNISDDTRLAMHILNLRDLIGSPPEGVSGEITREIRTIADYAGRFAFTDSERENIILAVK